jgi:hypothetical protein
MAHHDASCRSGVRLPYETFCLRASPLGGNAAAAAAPERLPVPESTRCCAIVWAWRRRGGPQGG